jgi:hypothetical protein
MNVVVVSCRLATLKTHLTPGNAHALCEMRLDTDAINARIVLQPIHSPGRSFFIEAPDRRLRLQSIEIPAQRRPPVLTGCCLAWPGLFVNEIS